MSKVPRLVPEQIEVRLRKAHLQVRGKAAKSHRIRGRVRRCGRKRVVDHQSSGAKQKVGFLPIDQPSLPVEMRIDDAVAARKENQPNPAEEPSPL